MLGAFGVLFFFIRSSGCLASRLGYDNTMLDNIRADVEAQNRGIGGGNGSGIEGIELRPMRRQDEGSEVEWDGFSGVWQRESFESLAPLLPVQPEQVYLPPPMMDEEELLGLGC